jgi:hypothetical protein
MGDLKGTYPAMMEQIEATMKKMLEDEIKIQPAHERMPLTVSGRIYTPAPGSGMFLVRLEPDQTQGGKVVILLIRWSDLYILAFYVKGTEFVPQYDNPELESTSLFMYVPCLHLVKMRHLLCSRIGSCYGI